MPIEFGDDYTKVKPDFVNDIETKFWVQRDLTRYAHGKGLKEVIVFLAELKDGSRSYLITENQEPLHESHQYEGVACYIDALWMARLPE